MGDHSFLDYDDVEEVHFEVNSTKEKHYIALEKDLATKIHHIAQRKGVSTETLANLWLNSKLTEAA